MTNNTYKTSIAMATYNGEPFIQEQIESFFNQKVLPDELVIYDDCSTDSTVPIINETTENAPFRVTINKNKSPLGYAQNFNKALNATSGEIIFLSDQDDIWLVTKVTDISNTFEKMQDIYLIIHDLEYCNEKLIPVGQTKLERLKSIGATHRSYVTGMATAVRRELLNICLPIPSNPLITHDLWLHECAHFLNVKLVLPEVLALYRRHGTNVTTGSVINSEKKTNFFSFIGSVDGMKTKQTIERKIAIMRELLIWSRRNDVIAFSQTQIHMKQCSLSKNRLFLEQELENTEKRLDLYEKNWPIKFVLAIKLFLKGGYAESMGIKSLIKDILASR